MRKIRKLIRRSIWIMSLVLIIIGLVNRDEITYYINQISGKENPWNIGKGTISIMGNKIQLLGEVINPDMLKSITLDGDTDADKVKNMISYLKQFNYSSEQNNPLNLFTEGGNCQAFALYVQKMAEENGIPSEIVTTPTHMYNLLTIDGETYKLDITNDVLEKEE